MLNLIEETIIYLEDVLSPAAQAGKKGDVRTVGRNISNFAANWLLQGGRIRHIRKDQVQEVLIELGLAEPEPTKEMKPKVERRTHGRKRTDNTKRADSRKGADSAADQGSDNKGED